MIPLKDTHAKVRLNEAQLYEQHTAQLGAEHPHARRLLLLLLLMIVVLRGITLRTHRIRRVNVLMVMVMLEVVVTRTAATRRWIRALGDTATKVGPARRCLVFKSKNGRHL